MNVSRLRMTPSQLWALALTSTASFMIALDGTVVTTALSTIRHDLGASVATLEWTVNAYVLSFAVLLMTGAALGDRFGRRRMFVAGLAIFMASSAACGLSPGIGVLIAARAVEGAGAALVMPLALTQLSAAFSAEQRGRALGIFSGMTGLATLSGPFIGGAIAQGLAWQWIFWINVPIGLIAIVGVLSRMGESHGPNGRFDVSGVLLAMGGAFGLVWGAVRASSIGWASDEVVVSMLAGSLLAFAFVGWEQRASAPMLPMRFFRSRAFALANAANFALIGSMYGVLFFLAQYLQTALGYGPLGAGLRLMPWTGTLLVCAPVAGNLADRLGERRFLAGGLLLQGAGVGWLALVARPGLAYPQMLLPLVISGCGVSMAMPAAQKAVVGAVGAQEIGQASGAFNMLRQLGGVFGIAAIVSVFAATGNLGSPRGFTDGFGPAMGVAAVLALAGAAAALGVPGRAAPRPAGMSSSGPAPAFPERVRS
jgi:EmrB/QacA subfamily drug resistance transporter